MRQRQKESRLALLGKAILANPQSTLSDLIDDADKAVRNKGVDRLSEFYNELNVAHAIRSKNQSKRQINEMKSQQAQILRQIEYRLSKNEQKLLINNQIVADNLQRSLEELMVRQTKVEMALEDRYNRQPQIQPVYIPYQPPQYGMQPQQNSQSVYAPPVPQRSKTKKKTISQRSIKPNFPQAEDEALESMYAPSIQANRRLATNLTAKGNIFQPAPQTPPEEPAPQEVPKAIVKPRPTTRRIRKYLLAVYYLQLIRSNIREKIFRRKVKSETNFNNIYNNALGFTCEKIIESCQSVQKTMTSHSKEKPEFLASEECYKEIESIIGVIVDRLCQLKDLLLKDRTLRTLLKHLIRQNQFLPHGYLTAYEASRLQFSVDFGFIYKTEDSNWFLVAMFLLVRAVVLGVCNQPLRLDVMFYKDEVAKGMLALLADGFYHLAISVIDSFREHLHQGNWQQLREGLKYIAAQTPTVGQAKVGKGQVQCVVGNWNTELLKFLSSREFWQGCRVRLRALIQEICLTMSEQYKSELSVVSRASKRQLSKNSQRSLK